MVIAWFRRRFGRKEKPVRTRRRQQPRGDFYLTVREWQAIRAYGRLWSVRLVAEEMQITEHTAKNHLNSAHRKFDVQTTGEVYLKLGWLKIPE